MWFTLWNDKSQGVTFLYHFVILSFSFFGRVSTIYTASSSHKWSMKLNVPFQRLILFIKWVSWSSSCNNYTRAFKRNLIWALIFDMKMIRKWYENVTCSGKCLLLDYHSVWLPCHLKFEFYICSSSILPISLLA